jgi:hypothetical protein
MAVDPASPEMAALRKWLHDATFKTRLETRQARFILIESEGFSMQRPRSVRARVRQRVDQDSAGENMEDFISIF